ncbi:hypothetical protein F7725_007974 [Dissostichus mawsoni]|uniref:NADP-dependent oxidoreductase domain-containing protein 1 n=1 Tax=Dissostichus mawsoni TaxID=36200 RepID=A0A7J5Y6X6_DISMA|nr:hypothetical protein F7725_007974 [Dissostichus mawsoni]
MEDDLLADVRSFSFENPLTEEEKELLYLRARSAGLTFCGCLIKSRRANRDSLVSGEDSDLCVGIIGMGHMGRQLLTSLLEKSGIKPSQIKISSRTPDSAVEFIQKGVECLFDNRRLAAWADVLFLCSLPSHLPKVCADLHSHLSKSCLVYSFTSAVPVNRLAQLLGHDFILKPQYDFVACHTADVVLTCTHLTTALTDHLLIKASCPLTMSSIHGGIRSHIRAPVAAVIPLLLVFPRAVTSKQSDTRPLDRLQNTDLSQSCTESKNQAEMDENKEDSVQHSEGNEEAPAERAPGEGGEENNSAGSCQLSAEMKDATPEPPTTWTSAALKELKAKLRTEDDSVVTVYRGDIMTVHVPTVPEAKKVCWEFATDGYDIGFGIYFDWSPVTSRSITVHISESSDEEEEEELEAPVGNGDVEKGSKTQTNSNLAEVLPVYRQDSHVSVQGGSHDFPGEGTYLLKFDNSYSLWRNKTLYYRVYYSA